MPAVIRALLQPRAELLDDPSPWKLARTAGLTAVGLAAYGFSTGCWRSPELGVYVALKMPMLIAATLGCNALLNGLLGLLLGGLGFRESLLALLSAFASAGLILGSLSPVTLMMALDAPPPDSPQAAGAHAGYLVFHVALIAIAGVTATVSLYRILLHRCPNATIAQVTLLAWLAGNGLLGAQFSWILRPFFGSPTLDVAFLRPHPLRGSFHEAVWHAVGQLTDHHPAATSALLVAISALVVLPLLHALRLSSNSTPSHHD